VRAANKATSRRNRSLEIGAALFVLLGVTALLFLTTQLPASPLKFETQPGYRVSAKFDTVGDLQVGAPVAMSGVQVGRVTAIRIDGRDHRAVVSMRIDAKYDRIPEDSVASVQTEGLLGGQYISLRPGGFDHYLKNGSVIEQTQSAIVLEDLINKFFAATPSADSSCQLHPGQSLTRHVVNQVSVVFFNHCARGCHDLRDFERADAVAERLRNKPCLSVCLNV
jgi:phospholipid/cholesterol/gamma-HCH transport system substrate-binding protein